MNGCLFFFFFKQGITINGFMFISFLIYLLAKRFLDRNWLESGDVNLDKISIFCCLNCLSECINGFSVLKNRKHSNYTNLTTQICRPFIIKFWTKSNEKSDQKTSKK
jgi:hypothetical protein